MPLEKRMLYFEFFQHTLPALLRNFDRASMMNSIEVRMPFMDWRLVTYAFSLPADSKVGDGFTKLVLREALKGRMKESLRTRTFKVGISSPVDHWFKNELKSWIKTEVDISLKQIAGASIEGFSRPVPEDSRSQWKLINTALISS